MNEKQPVRAVKLQIITLVVLAITLVTPIALYVFTFGFSLSTDHTRWAEMGSAMAGIYSPIFALLALVVLISQVRLQYEINRHQFDQAYIQEARSDIQYYLQQLDSELAKKLETGSTTRDFLHSVFELADTNILRSKEHLQVAREFHNSHPRVFSNWVAIYTIFDGLRSQKQFPYFHNFEAAKQKTIAMTTYATSVALDNYIWCLSEGNLPFKCPTLSSGRNGV